MSQLDDLDDLIASLDTSQKAPPVGRRDSIDALLESLGSAGSPPVNKRASRPVSKRLSRRPGLAAPPSAAPMPAGATSSFEALLDSLTSESPANGSPHSSGAATRTSRALQSPPPAAHPAKDPDALLDQLLESLDINGSPAPTPAPAPVRAPVAAAAGPRASLGYQQAPTNQRASLARPVSPAQPAVPVQASNQRTSVRQEAASTIAGVEDSLDSLLAALDGASEPNVPYAPQAAARASSVGARQSIPAPAPQGQASASDFDSLLAQLGESTGEPVAAPVSASRRQPQPEIATLRPSFAEKVRQSMPQPMHATLEELGAADEWNADPRQQLQPSRASVVNYDQGPGPLQPQYATVENIDPPHSGGYGPRPVSQQYAQPQAPLSGGYGGSPSISPSPSPYSSAGFPSSPSMQPAAAAYPGAQYPSQQPRFSQQPPSQQHAYQQPPYQQPPYQSQQPAYQQTPYQQPPYQQSQQPSYQAPYQQPQQQPYQQPYRPPVQQPPSYQSPQPAYQQPPYQQPAYQSQQPSPQSYQQYSTNGPRPSTPLARPVGEFNPSTFEEEFKREVNLMRRDPQAYARLIETERRPYYQDKIFAAPGVQRLLTREGIAACDEAIHFLLSCRPAPEVEFDSGLCLAAQQAVNEGAPTGSTNISSLAHLQSYGVLTGEISELSKFGALSGREMLMTWLISDGDASRLHRTVVTDPKWSKMGVAAAKHNSVYKTVGIATFCTGFESNTAVMDKMNQFNYLWTGS